MSYDAFRHVWERDIGHAFGEEGWTSICKRVYPKCTYINTQELNPPTPQKYHRTYFTPVRLHIMFSNASHLCFKCKQYTGTFMHIWCCSIIQCYWNDIRLHIQKILGRQLALSPNVFLLYFDCNIVFDPDSEVCSIPLFT